jgi:transcriptional regulator with XRE-family HTH domain
MAEYYQISRQVGRRIAMTRQAHGLSAADLAERLRWPRDTLVNYETGRRRLTVEHLIAIADALGVPPATLLLDDSKLAALITELVHEPGAIEEVLFFLRAREDEPPRQN